MKTIENISIGLEDVQRQGVIAILTTVLANQHVLYIKVRNFHWNLKGGRFHTLHEFYEEQYLALAEAIDQTAERIRMLGGSAPGSMKEFLAVASLEEQEGQLIAGEDSIKHLVSDHEKCVRGLRKAVAQVEDEFDDVGTADFLTGLLQSHEQHAWMLRSFLL